MAGVSSPLHRILVQHPIRTGAQNLSIMCADPSIPFGRRPVHSDISVNSVRPNNFKLNPLVRYNGAAARVLSGVQRVTFTSKPVSHAYHSNGYRVSYIGGCGLSYGTHVAPASAAPQPPHSSRQGQIPTVFFLKPQPPLRSRTDSYASSSTCTPFAFGHIHPPGRIGIPESDPQCWVDNPTA